MDTVDQLVDTLPVDDLIKGIGKIASMGVGGFICTIVLALGAVVLKIWWDRHKKELKQRRTEHERNKERGLTVTENQTVQDEWTAAQRELDGLRAKAPGIIPPTDAAPGSPPPIPKPKRPQ